MRFSLLHNIIDAMLYDRRLLSSTNIADSGCSTICAVSLLGVLWFDDVIEAALSLQEVAHTMNDVPHQKRFGRARAPMQGGVFKRWPWRCEEALIHSKALGTHATNRDSEIHICS